MASLVTYDRTDSVSTITMDDGKVNVLSISMLEELNAALDHAVADRTVVVLRGRDGVFSAGFDLKVLNAGGNDALAMLRGGFELAERLLSFPTPVLNVCTGHTIAMGGFLLLSGDYRLGIDGPFRITANEVAIGLTLPEAAIELCRQRLTPAGFNRAVALAEVFSPETAVTVGYLDRIVPADALEGEVAAKAAELAALDMRAHSSTKLRARAATLAALHAAIEADDAALRPA